MDRRRHAGINGGKLWQNGQAAQLNWEGGFKFTSADAHGHSITVEAPRAKTKTSIVSNQANFC